MTDYSENFILRLIGQNYFRNQKSNKIIIYVMCGEEIENIVIIQKSKVKEINHKYI